MEPNTLQADCCMGTQRVMASQPEEKLPEGAFKFSVRQIVTLKEWRTYGTLMPRPLVVSGRALIEEGGRVARKYAVVDELRGVEHKGVVEDLLEAYPDVPLPAANAAHLAMVLQQGIIAKAKASQTEAVAAGGKEQDEEDEDE